MRLLRTLILDLFLVVIATVLAGWLRDNFDVSQERIIALLPYVALTVVFAAIVLPSFGVVRTVWRFTSMRDYLAIVAATGAIIVGALAAGFVINRLDGIARALPILQGLLIVSLLVGARIVTRVRHAPRGRPAQSAVPRLTRETVLVVGLNKLTELYLHCVAELAPERVMVAGILDPGGHVGLSLHFHPVLGEPEQVADVLRDLEIRGVFVDRIVVTLPLDSLAPAARDALRAVEANTTIAVEFLDRKMGFDQRVAGTGEQASRDVQPDGEEQVFALSAADALAASPYARVKRTLDVVAAFVLLIALSPVMALVGLLVAFDVGLPILFWQQRPGLAGRSFRVYKFRTMGAAHDEHGRRRPDAERVSAIGHFLRRTRLDELPQLFSILAGHMSFVGPRPLLPVDQSAGYAARLLVRPGLTGWAQIKGGRTIYAADKAALDVWYVNNVSFVLDMKILLATVPMVLFGERVTHQAIVQAWSDLHDAGICSASELAPKPVLVFSDR